jgi:hypothetical protein
MYNLIFKNFNIITFPKVGCTQIIKLCTDTEEYKNHKHSFENNKCSRYGNIHNCGLSVKSENPNLEYLVFYRYPHERILSFFKGNCYYHPAFKEMSLDEFIEKITEKGFSEQVFDHHLFSISSFKPKNKYKYYHLDELNNVWLNYFGIDIKQKKITNKTNSQSLEINEKQLLKIKDKYKNEYEFLNKIIR